MKTVLDPGFTLPCVLLLCFVNTGLTVTNTVSSTSDSGANTLRTAITQLNANTNPGPHTIVFKLSGGAGVKTITLITPLPDITNSMIIDGWSQGGTGYSNSPLIELNGNNILGFGLRFFAPGNTVRGLTINRFVNGGALSLEAGGNRIYGNYIGTDSTGTLALSTNSVGITILSPSNVIGGTNASERNIISGNFRGITLYNLGAHHNSIQGNYIGLNASGTTAVPNNFGGILINATSGDPSGDYAADNTIGGLVPGARNVISGNGFGGILLDSLLVSPPFGPTRNIIIGNYIGTDKDGLLARPNNGPGIWVATNAIANVIGGFTPAERNIISGNLLDGIQMEQTSRSNIIRGNWIGLNASAVALPNLVGISMFNSSNNIIGSGNVISGNSVSGIEISRSVGNQIIGNLIGLAPNGQTQVANEADGIEISDSTNNVIGPANSIVGNFHNGVLFDRGTGAGSVSNTLGGNFIAENLADGVLLSGGARGNRIVGNTIGAGTVSGIQFDGNLWHGLAILDSTNNFIGGPGSGEPNYISGNTSNGVFIGKGDLNSGSSSNLIRGNRIGTTPVGNGHAGIFVQGDWNRLGGTNQGEGNLIFDNGADLQQRGHGIVIASGEHNPILGNRIWGNSGRGIDLGNDSFTVNDLGDADSGANDLQNYPVVTRVAFYPDYGFHDVTWTLNGKTNRPYYIEWFANSTPDPSGFGEGQDLIPGAIVTTDAKGFVTVTIRINLTDEFISATATDLSDWNTSEFSPVDTDGDAIADAWETRGIDYDEDGTIDLVLTNSHTRLKDIYVEIDAMSNRVPDMDNLARVNGGTVDKRGNFQNDGFFNAPADAVQNPSGAEGIIVHMELDETNLPLAAWSANETNEFYLFDVLKTNHFGTVQQQANPAARKAKALVYHYCIFADEHPGFLGCARGFTANDFVVAAGARASSPTDGDIPATFMHELGHCLGLRHGGQDNDLYKPNYHSLMNYGWTHPLGNIPWSLDFSREAFPALDENNLDEQRGIGAPATHTNHFVKIGPYRVGTNAVPVTWASEVGPVDWNGNTNLTDQHVIRDVNYLSKDVTPATNILAGNEDWSRLRYYFLDTKQTGQAWVDELTNDLNPVILEDYSKLGTGFGQFQFNQLTYSVSETGMVAMISVTRIFEAEGNVSVSFSTVDGTATNGVDYVSTNGVLTFTGAESVKDFAVPIMNDGIAEERKFLRLVLSSPSPGTSLGPQDEAILTILDDDSPGHFTVSNTNNNGPGSLRQAMLDANAAPGLGIIEFNIPPTNALTISPTTALPTLTNSILIDGTTQPGFTNSPIVELNGTTAGAGSDGLKITAGHCTVRGLVINRFSGHGINLLTGGANHVEGCYVGLNRQGSLDQGNNGNGINVQSAENVIGGTNTGTRNFISGNNGYGVAINGLSATNNQVLGNVIGLGADGSDQGNTTGINLASSFNTIGGRSDAARNVISGNDLEGIFISAGTSNGVLGNFIGTDSTGTLARGNGTSGIRISGANGQIIGGNKLGAGNLISGNGQRGIQLDSASGNLVLGNIIGMDSSGTNGLTNLTGAIVLNFGSGGNQIGDTTRFGGNTIAVNTKPAVAVVSVSDVSNRIRGNSTVPIVASSIAAISIDLGPEGPSTNDAADGDTGANQLQNFPILSSASNSLDGTLISGNLNSRPNTNFTLDFYADITPNVYGLGKGQHWIGSATVTTDTNGNVSFSAFSPAVFLNGRYVSATATDDAGNTSELSPAVAADIPIEGRTYTVLNTNDSGEGSLRQAILDANANISRRDTIAFEIPGAGVHTIRPLSPLPSITDPVLIDGYTQPGSLPNTAATGHNGVLLIELDGSAGSITNGLKIESGDSIVRGLVINRFGTNADPSNFPGGILLAERGGNCVEGCFIGTDPTGFLDRGNTGRGVAVFRSSTNVIGGTVPSARNVISANHVTPGYVSGEAIMVYGDSVLQFSGNRIEGNLIGTAADGITPLGNAGCAVRLGQPVTNTTIGGIIPGAGNVIAFNAAADPPQNACGVDDPLKFGVHSMAVLGNSIYSNNGMGIGGNRVNSPDGRGNFPFLSSAVSTNGTATIQGRLNSVSNAIHRIEFFANDILDPTGFGEGKTFLGAINALTDSNGFAAFTAVLPVAVSNTMFLTATATDDQNNTSEFSPRLRVGDVLTNVIVVNSFNDVDDGVANTNHTSLREAIFAANNHTGPDTIRFAIGTGIKGISISNALPALMDAGTTIDATTQPGFTNKPIIYLDGLLLAPTGFRLYSPSNTIRGFAINRFGYGIYGDAAFSSPFGGFNVIEGNYIGTDLTGSGSAGSQDWGIYLTSSFLAPGCSSNRIGGATAASRNIISGNNKAGVYAFGCDGNVFVGNFIGTDATGSNAVPNGRGFDQQLGGMFIQSCRGTILGGPAPGMGNLISGNGSIFGNQSFLWGDSSGSIVQGNYFGTDVGGHTNVGNSLAGLDISGSGLVLVKSNLFSGGAANHGSLFLGSPSNRVEGNFIGTDVTGTRMIPSGPSGIVIDFIGVGNVIGGTNVAARNLISGGGYGVTIRGQSNIIQGNFIGTQINGASPLTNFFDGVLVQGSLNQIGGTDPGQGNIIAFSVGSGVNISGGTNNSVLGNSIFSNSGLGIDLGSSGVTTNDFGDTDAGANNLQNFPLLSAARNIGTGTFFDGILNSRSNTSFRIEFFSNTNCHLSGNGEGRAYLNFTTVTTDASGNAAFSFNHPVAIPAGQIITATATDTNGNTSEFSPCITVVNDTNYVVLAFSPAPPYTLSWPISASGFVLERATNLTPPTTWQIISNGFVTNGIFRVFTVTNDSASPERYFRLRR